MTAETMGLARSEIDRSLESIISECAQLELRLGTIRAFAEQMKERGLDHPQFPTNTTGRGISVDGLVSVERNIAVVNSLRSLVAYDLDFVRGNPGGAQ